MVVDPLVYLCTYARIRTSYAYRIQTCEYLIPADLKELQWNSSIWTVEPYFLCECIGIFRAQAEFTCIDVNSEIGILLTIAIQWNSFHFGNLHWILVLLQFNFTMNYDNVCAIGRCNILFVATTNAKIQMKIAIEFLHTKPINLSLVFGTGRRLCILHVFARSNAAYLMHNETTIGTIT